MIKARSGATIIVQTSDSPRVIVSLNDETQVSQIEGVLKARRKDMSMAALIPGLEIQVEGSYDSRNQLVAKLVKFEGSDLERAQFIQAGVHETQEHAQQTRQELEKQRAELKAQAESLKQQQGQLTAQQQKIAANKATIDAAIARFGQLDDYYILDEVTVHFGNGKVAIDPPYETKLLKLAEKAKTIEAYNIQVVGYASSTGSVALNQKLSEDRADSVTNLLVQQGNIPLTNLLAPGAMGETRQIGDDKTAEGQAQNRRVIVRVLQNKGIAGLHSLP
jgi:outer membrane protein OmpA-like peptidoglycan-associated protein